MSPHCCRETSVAPGMPRSDGGLRRLWFGCRCQFLLAQNLTVGTVPSHFGPRQDDLKSEMSLDLFPHLLQQIPEELFDFAAAQTNHMGMFLFQPRLVVMLVPVVMHQVQLVNQTAGLQELERSVNGDPVQLRVFFARQRKQALGIQMLAGLIDEIEQDLPLARKPNTLLFQRIFDSGNRHEGTLGDPPRRVPKRGHHRKVVRNRSRREGSGQFASLDARWMLRITRRRGSKRCCGLKCRADHLQPGSNSIPRKYPISRYTQYRTLPSSSPLG